MIFEKVVYFPPTSLKRHRHTFKGRTYDPSSGDKKRFLKMIDLPITKMSGPISCTLIFFSKRPKSHYRTGKYSNQLKKTAPIFNMSKKILIIWLNLY